jgi:hypothetical protein
LKLIYDSIEAIPQVRQWWIWELAPHREPKDKVGLALRNVGFQTSYYTDFKSKNICRYLWRGPIHANARKTFWVQLTWVKPM